MFPKEATRTLTFTIIKRAVIHLALIGLFAVFALAQTNGKIQTNQRVLGEDVRRLGLPGNDDFADVKRLARTPAASAELLVSQLSVLDHPERTLVGDGSPRVEHVLWSFLALRYITGGMDFCAPTRWKFGTSYEEGVRDYWLHFYDKSCVVFFSDWPSHGRTYIAPFDAQQAIISAWRRWYGHHREDSDYHPLVNPPAHQWPESVQKLVRISNE
jgi:hypothetical protein